MQGIRYIRRMWRGMIVADIKIADGALDEVQMVRSAGANAVTVLGNAPRETINICHRCLPQSTGWSR